ncbi:hypothetical protein PHMEG_00020941 [Phytophthora megakarya]|uniref:Uncharacterized protein n=1 Tax=Phytophthora megakarya TaxID=4795 RepID=A0A225VN47_9STRA|nr:hypothetical protein PHMEG_00020941 [Phytophthora megakarya]
MKENGEFVCDQSFQDAQLRMFLGGDGGTGESRVIEAVEGLCNSWARRLSIVKTALTGKAGKTTTIIGGKTLASFILALERGLSTVNIENLDTIVVDEVSIIKKAEFSKPDRLPPVGAAPLFVDPSKKQECTTADIAAFKLWRSLRTSQCDFALTQSGGKAAEQLGVEYGQRDLFPENSTRAAINNQFIVRAVASLSGGKYPARLVANFKGALQHLIRPEIDMVMNLPDSRFGRMAPVLALIPVMPIQITQKPRLLRVWQMEH